MAATASQQRSNKTGKLYTRKAHRSLGEKTRNRILETAERLFSDHGVEGVSLRTLVAQARVNLAAISYHFGSKAELFEEVFARRAQEITEKRLLLLAECRDEPSRPPMLEQILEAFLAPVFDPDGTGRKYARIRARLAAENTKRARDLPSKYFDASSKVFLQALHRDCPHLAPEDLYWRFHIMIGAMFFTIANTSRIERLSNNVVNTSDNEAALKYLVRFFATAFRITLRDGSMGEREGTARPLESKNYKRSKRA